MLRIAILDDYQRVALAMADWARLGPDAEVVAFDHHLAVPDEAAAALADFDVICLMRERMAVPRALIARLPRLKLIVMSGSQSQSIDFAAAAERGIPVCRTSTQLSHSAAEHAFGLILCCARNIAQEAQNMRAGGWQSTVGVALHRKTLGLLGLGALGTMVARYGNAFGIKQFLAAGAMQVCQIDACRLGGVNEVVAVLLLAAAARVPVCPHAGGVGLCELVQHLAVFGHVALGTPLEGTMIEFVDHLHEHFLDPVVIHDGAYVVPERPGYSAEIRPASLAAYRYPDGPEWA